MKTRYERIVHSAAERRRDEVILRGISLNVSVSFLLPFLLLKDQENVNFCIKDLPVQRNQVLFAENGEAMLSPSQETAGTLNSSFRKRTLPA